MNKYEKAYKIIESIDLQVKDHKKENYTSIPLGMCCPEEMETLQEAINKAQALDTVFELIKERVKNAELQLERNYKCLDELNHKVCSTAVEMVECEEEKRRISEIYNLRLREEIDTYNDCIMLIIMSQVRRGRR